jgi:diguanylate cyclase (GGDEF)-like protein
MRWHIDHLTGLHNREAFARRLRHARSLAVRGSVVLLDIDHFKVVNDRHGLQMGDEALRGVARRLSESLPHDTVLSRIGGDEFMVFLPDVETHAAEGVMRRCLDRVKEPLERLDGMAPLTMSGGLAAFDGHGIDDVFKACDIAMAAAKQQGCDRVLAFDDRIQPLAQARRELASMVIELQQRNRALEDEVHLDALTELRNRRALDKVLDRVTGAPGSFGPDTAVCLHRHRPLRCLQPCVRRPCWRRGTQGRGQGHQRGHARRRSGLSQGRRRVRGHLAECGGRGRARRR